ncbi:hypothetical protein [Myxosarcina sp. GI1]|uniref:hypothetical protein n=1 Tax=Myxosarcina sp. GI1 TaxID=1541065 RepID=UPI00055DFD54|nr:hypothetical protein [Myxosarcina sp. GI1]
MQDLVTDAIALKEALLDFVYDAEGEIAVALETYAAEHGSKDKYDIKQQNIIVDTFLTEGRVNETTPLELFMEERKDLNEIDCVLLELWQRNFTGLFEIKAISTTQLKLMNWLTAKEYLVVPHSSIPTAESDRWQQGEILLTRLAPLTDDFWFFFSDRSDKGKLGKPKLAVAIGEFRTKFGNQLYGDAPELLAEAWDSVAVYHQEFIDYFGSDRLTMPGEELNQKLGELQSKMSQKRLEAAGIDSSKSMQELMQESGADVSEIEEAADLSGSDTEAVAKVLKSKKKLSSVIPKIDLPPEIKAAELVTVFSHPKWGQMYLPNYLKLIDLLDKESPETDITCQYLVRKYLEEPQTNYYIWQLLVKERGNKLEKVLQTVLNNPNLKLETDLPATLQKYDKPLHPVLPDIASVPIHLNNLFEEAVAQVQKSKSKSKKKKKKKGFL